jgi:hypothetical protein
MTFPSSPINRGLFAQSKGGKEGGTDAGTAGAFCPPRGVHFSNRVPPEEINRFVRELPPEKRESLFEVLKELEQAGMIVIHNDGIWADGEGKVGGSREC